MENKIAQDALSHNMLLAEAWGTIATGFGAMLLVIVTYRVFVRSGSRLIISSGVDQTGHISIVIVNRGRADSYVEFVGLATRPRRRIRMLLRRPQEVSRLRYPDEYGLIPSLDREYSPPKEIEGGGDSHQASLVWPQDLTILAERELWRWWPKRQKLRIVVAHGPDQENIRAFAMDANGKYKFCRVKDMRMSVFDNDGP